MNRNTATGRQSNESNARRSNLTAVANADKANIRKSNSQSSGLDGRQPRRTNSVGSRGNKGKPGDPASGGNDVLSAVGSTSADSPAGTDDKVTAFELSLYS